MGKRPWHCWVFIGIVLFIYGMGLYDLFMMLSHNAAYYAARGYGQAVVDYFTNYPFQFLIFWVLNLSTGFSAPIALVLDIKWGKALAFVSAVADGILLGLTFAFRDRLAALGAGVALFDGFILLLTASFFFYCWWLEKRLVVE